MKLDTDAHSQLTRQQYHNSVSAVVRSCEAGQTQTSSLVVLTVVQLTRVA
jgi:hypothetical protein